MIKRIFRALFYTVVTLIIGFLIFGWWTSKQAHYYQTELGPQLRQQYGFATGTPIINIGGKRLEVLTIYPEKDGPLEKAGFKNEDIVLSTTLTGFYQSLHSQKRPLSYTVVDGGDGISLKDRPTRTIIIND